MQTAICLRASRAVVSRPFRTDTGQRGYEPCANWRDLEFDARQAVMADHEGGPFVFDCPDTLAQAAIWPESEASR